MPGYAAGDDVVRYVEPGDDLGLVQAIVEVMSDDVLAERLARGGRRCFERHFTLEQFVRGMHEVYARLAGRPQSTQVSPFEWSSALAREP
jgi:glycosyltransferase involved in cell wall biosynthesis